MDQVRGSDAASFLLSSASGEGRFLYVQEMRDKEDVRMATLSALCMSYHHEQSPRFWKLLSAFAFTDLGVARLAPPILELSHESSFSLPIPLTGVS